MVLYNKFLLESSDFMFGRALDNLKTHLYIEKEHSQSDRNYIRKLQESLGNDLLHLEVEFFEQRDMLRKKLKEVEGLHIEDEFLLVKCKEAIEESVKLSKKLSKYQSNKKVKYVKFRDMYNAYSLITDVNHMLVIIRSYLTQLTRYTKSK